MKVYEDKTIPARTTRICIKRKCDLCGIESDSEEWSFNWAIWSKRETEILIAIKSQDSSHYGDSIVYEIDLCPDCFQERLVSWLKSQGADVEEKSF